MKHFNQLILSVALALCGVTSAFAGAIYVPMDSGAPGDFTNTWSFSDASTGAPDDPFPDPHAAGTSFDDLFIFDVPDSENISLSVSSVVQDGLSGVDFSEGGFALWGYADGNLLALQFATDSNSLSGGAWALTSGVYAFEIVGDFAADGGTYAGQISEVPEPTGVLLLLAGLAALVGAMRHRRGKF